MVIKNLAEDDATQYTVEASGIRQTFRVKLAELKKSTTSAIEAELEGERKFKTTIRNQQSYVGKDFFGCFPDRRTF